MSTNEGKFKNFSNVNASDFIKKYGIVFVLLIMIIAISIASPTFLTSTNIFNVFTQTAITGIMALGMTFVIISKGIDLSVGSVLAFSGVVAASLAQVTDATNKFYPHMGQLPAIISILAAMAVGTMCGIVSGWLIAKTHIPAFISTLGMMTIARGLTLIYTQGKPVSNLQSGITMLGGKVFNVIPVPVLIYAVAILISWILLNNTRFGKHVYAIGANSKAAEVSGINVGKNIIAIYAYSGLFAGIAAIVFAGRVGSVHPGAAVGYELTAIASTTIGGTSHSGGIGTIWGAVVGALILSVLANALTLLGVDAYWQQVFVGMIIIGAVVLDMRKNTHKK